jgi:hypothetical protein
MFPRVLYPCKGTTEGLVVKSEHHYLREGLNVVFNADRLAVARVFVYEANRSADAPIFIAEANKSMRLSRHRFQRQKQRAVTTTEIVASIWCQS